MGLEGVSSYLCFALCAGGQASPAQKQEQHLQKQLQQQLCRDSRSNSNCTRWGSSRKSSSSSCSSSSSSNSCREPIGAADDAAAAAADRRRRGSIGPSRSRQRNSSRRWAHAVGALSPQAGALIASAIRPWKVSFDTGALSPRGGSNPPKKLEKEPFEKRLLSQRDYFSNKLFLEVSDPKKLKNSCFEKRARVQLLLAPLNPYFGGLGRIFGMTSRDVAINHPD